jgi:diguanylate cyclase (GGDEF)-like protein
MTRPAEPIPNIPGSRYSAELAKGARDMRFPPDLEREYHHFYIAERRTHVRSFNVIMSVLFACAWASSWLVSSPTDPAQQARLGGIVVAYLIMVWAAYSRHHERVYLGTAQYASLAVALLAAIEVVHRIHGGAGEAFGFLTVYSIGLYFLAGILYRAALQANIVMIVAFTASLLWLRESPAKVAELSVALAATAGIGGIAFRHQGIRFRRTFLERGLIAEMATRDGLTGLKNRRAFDEHLQRTWQQALRDRRTFAVLMIDADHFKEFNDSFGHQAGDAALQRVAAVVDGFAKRPLDLAARYGGDELAVALFDISREHLARLAEELRAAVDGLRIYNGEHASTVLTVSVGGAIVHPTLERSPEGAVQLADEALYAAKREGRNTVRILESEYRDLSTGTFRRR